MPGSFRLLKPEEYEALRRDDTAYLICRPGDAWNPADDLAEHFWHEAQEGLVAGFNVDHWPLAFFQTAPRRNQHIADAQRLHVNVFHMEADMASLRCQTCGAYLHAEPTLNRFTLL